MSITLLVGHTSQETAHCTPDYPCGFRRRCQRREWLEFQPKKGYRLVTQTSDPKYTGLKWNKPKASTYAPLGVLFQDDQGHVQWDTLGAYATLAQLAQFAATYGEALQGAREAAILEGMRHRAQIEAEQRLCRVALAELDGPVPQGTGVHLSRCFFGGRGYASIHATFFWTRDPALAAILPDAASAEALIAAYPHALADATVQTRAC